MVDGHSFAYKLTGFTNILRRLVDSVPGKRTFTPDGDGTLIRWMYEFKPLRRRHTLVRLRLAPLWRRYVQAGVAAAARLAEDRRAVATTREPLIDAGPEAEAGASVDLGELSARLEANAGPKERRSAR